jgi:hypothetical protein
MEHMNMPGRESQPKEKWEQVTDKYIEEFNKFVEVSRELNTGVDFAKGEMTPALSKLRSAIQMSDMYVVKSILEALEGK